MKNKFINIFGIILSFILLLSFISPISVFADDPVVSSYDKYDKTVSFNDNTKTITASNLLVQMRGKSGTGDYENGNVTFDTSGTLSMVIKGETINILQVPTAGGEIKINSLAFKNYSSNKELTKAMKIFVDALSKTEANPDVKQQIMADMQDIDSSVSSIMLPLIFQSTKGDMYQAYKITSPFLNLLSIVLGVGAVILILLLLFSTVMDLAYIGLPVWREAQQSKNGNNGKNPFGVSYEALTTVKEVEKGLGGGDGGYRNAYLLYFRRRALTYIILAICIMYLICGGLSGIIGFVLSLVSGITG